TSTPPSTTSPPPGPPNAANNGSCVASDFARQIPVSFRPHLTRLLVFTKEAIVDDDDSAQAEAVLDSRAEVRLVGADAHGADLGGRRRRGGGGGPVGDHPDPRGGPRRGDRRVAGLQTRQAPTVPRRGQRGRRVARRGGPAASHHRRAGGRVGGAPG